MDVRILANRSAALLIAERPLEALADALAACHLADAPHQKAAHRVKQARRASGIGDKSPLLDLDFNSRLWTRGHGAPDALGVEAAVERANKLYRECLQTHIDASGARPEGRRATVTSAVDAYSEALAALDPSARGARAAALLSHAQAQLEHARELRVEKATPLVNEASDACVAAACLAPPDLDLEARGRQVVGKCRDALLAIVPSEASFLEYGDESRRDTVAPNTVAALSTAITRLSTAQQVEMFGMHFVPIKPLKPQTLKSVACGVAKRGKWVNAITSAGFGLCCGLPHLMIPGLYAEGSEPPMDWMQKRLGAIRTVERFNWWEEACIGDVDPTPPPAYVAAKHYALKNQVEFPMSWLAGDMLLVGHAMGLESIADIVPSTLPAEGGGQNVMTVTGVELDAFNAAACRVLWRVVRDCGNEEFLLQLLYSTTWSPAAFQAFQTAARAELADVNDARSARASDALLAHLERWASAAPAPLAEARAHHHARLDRCPDGTAATGCWMLKAERDRCEVLAYELTGDMPPMRTPTEARVASLLLADRSDDEMNAHAEPASVFPTLPLNALSADGDNVAGLSFMTRVERALRRRCAQLISVSASGAVCAQFVHGDISTIAPAMQLQGLHTVVWSNLCDYMSFEEFHKLARSVGSEGVVHHMHSMNWMNYVFGANLIDTYRMKEGRKKAVLELVKYGMKMQKLMLDKYNLSGVFRIPLPENPINTASHPLVFKLGYNWASTFAIAGRKRGFCNAQLLGTQPVIPLSRTGECTIHLLVTYDEETGLESTGAVQDL